ncbi:HDOD domain-containing protein [Candidatus Berkiella aquae]|uniref:HDOD domain protein n=1 Tax=Candidatus Berkiella aquae TaxID=295108 RepID=A0A0Q9YWH2_9GAMM|nr:HDOD domain-containing protein [Candidatus Berkiella aquae]MCS5711071.1 HDOD domain-containing protein [Candidatus Berkiella aquae]
MDLSLNASATFFMDLLEAIERNRLPLPTQPEIAMAIQEVSQNPYVTIEELEGIIGKDPALTARIIRLANSPLVRGRVAINSLENAISRLGVRFVSNMAIGLAMEQLFLAKHKVIEQKLNDAWKHSGQIAATSYVIANYTKKFAPDEAMLAGLLHEIGILPILTYAETQPELLKNLNVLDELIQNHYAKLGEAILNSWQFPPNIANIPQNMTQYYRKIPKADLADVILVAKIFVLEGTPHPLAQIDRTEIPAFNRLGLDPKENLLLKPALQEPLMAAEAIFK